MNKRILMVGAVALCSGVWPAIASPQAAAPVATPAPVAAPAPVAPPALTPAPDQQLGAISPATAPKNTPEQVVSEYLVSLSENNNNPDRPLYTRATREMMHKGPTPTAAQNARMVYSYLSCVADKPIVSGKYAVVRYRLTDYKCSPFFLVVEGGRWRLDLATLSNVVRFSAENRWHVRPGVASPYAFGFTDWTFDPDGFPIKPPAPAPAK